MAARPRRIVLHRIIAIGAWAGIWAGIATLAGPATAAPANDARACVDGTGDAIAACTRAIASGKFKQRVLAILYATRGSELGAKGQHDPAIADFDRAIKLEPNTAAIYSGRGSVYSAKGENDRAITDYDQAIRLDPKAASSYSGRGNAYSAKGDSDRAIADFDQAIKLNPEAALSYYDRGTVHATKGAMDAAIADYGQAIRLYPEFAAAYANRGNARTAKGDLAAAIADYDQALRLDPQLVFTYRNRGMAYLKLDQIDRAITDFDAALKLDPSHAAAQYGRGIAKLKKGDTHGGNSDIAVAKIRQSDVAEVVARAGVIPPGSGAPVAPIAAVAPVAVPPPPPAAFAPLALGEAAVKAVFEKHNLLGFFAPNCGRPASKDNLYYANRLNGDRVQTDQMSSATERDFVMFLDKAGEISLTEIVVTGTREGQPTHMIWRVERTADGSGMRVRPAEVSWGGKKLVSDERMPDSGREMPWLQRCGAPG